MSEDKSVVKRLTIKRNPSYLESLKLGLVVGIWWAPASWLKAVGPDFMLIFASIGNFAMSTFGWFNSHAYAFGMGVAGRLTPIPLEPEAEKTQPPEA